ncbi:ATP-binding protein [Pseudomonas sp. URIL14HWK12:I5]|uniref:AAA family ATPase n=1 Tax=Pseudomonas sp. URIL14HWK12:I5 TaxID=1261630 RepID=UPI0009D90911|nr:ATP-binding protein [Pseudomonas sp. URIL14HWK12:I5]SMC58027.1 Predicted kinase [Pseudomonas sp. URIL14HWK12:I5]
MPTPPLHLMTGKIASGKSTLAKSLATELSAVLLSEDHWLSKLYPGQVKSVTDYVRFSRQIREVVGPLVTDMLRAGVTVVLDFPANTLQDRQWLRSLADAAEVAHCVHYLEVHDDVCRSRLHIRNSRAEHEFAATDAEFDLITSYFQAPDKNEGLQIEIHRI